MSIGGRQNIVGRSHFCEFGRYGSDFQEVRSQWKRKAFMDFQWYASKYNISHLFLKPTINISYHPDTKRQIFPIFQWLNCNLHVSLPTSSYWEARIQVLREVKWFDTYTILDNRHWPQVNHPAFLSECLPTRGLKYFQEWWCGVNNTNERKEGYKMMLTERTILCVHAVSNMCQMILVIWAIHLNKFLWQLVLP